MSDMQEDPRRYVWSGADFELDPFSRPEPTDELSTDEWDAQSIGDLPDRIVSAHVELGDVDFEWADQNPEAWKIVERTQTSERVAELRRLAEALADT